ncbi:MAG: N-acetyltransferase family protein [Pseudomonadota bacterium]
MDYEIRAARATDIPMVRDIFNEIVATSTAIFQETPATLEDRQAWFQQKQAQAEPMLVASNAAGEVFGFATYGTFRDRPCYRFTVEHTVHVAASARGQGVGAALLEEVIAQAREAKLHVMIAGVDAANEGGIRFHKAHGFEEVGHLRQVGFKFGRWLDLVFMQRIL